MSALSPFCIVGLGNPGRKYQNTRHNVGFLFLDYLVEHYCEGKGTLSSTHWLGKTVIQGLTVFLLKPMQYMNLSGLSLVKIVQYYKIPWRNILICYDDMAFPVGEFRLKAQGGAGGHNGLASILQSLSTDTIARLRFGISSQEGKGNKPLSDFVLSNFSKQERIVLDSLLPRAKEIVEIFCTQGVQQAMNIANRKDG